jgi:hypothetical protein
LFFSWNGLGKRGNRISGEPEVPSRVGVSSFKFQVSSSELSSNPLVQVTDENPYWKPGTQNSELPHLAGV